MLNFMAHNKSLSKRPIALQIKLSTSTELFKSFKCCFDLNVLNVTSFENQK